ncbi:hypothetical protein [Nostoc sp. PA-18-2419]|uniref:hypothetical protein n=1 Tax=Nostoc sp. PA-18-2419 TaxID=2575443 RepID=UPI0011089C89|nr:hypothetical protein [Nostoc sp. PA-18-2419]
MPTKITAPFFATAACKAYKEDKESSRVIWNLTVPVCEVPQGLPLDPNARLANENRRTVKSRPLAKIFYGMILGFVA